MAGVVVCDQLTLSMSGVLCKFACSTMIAKACVAHEGFAAGGVAPSVTIAKLRIKNVPGVLHTVQLEASEDPQELWLAPAPKVAKSKVDDETAAMLAGFEALDPKPKRPRSDRNGSASGSGLASARGPVRDGVALPAFAAPPGDDEDDFVRCGAASDEEEGALQEVDLEGVARPNLSDVLRTTSGAASSSGVLPPAAEMLGSSSSSSSAPANAAAASSASSSAAPAVVAPPPPVSAWWVTRTGRKALCSSCHAPIDAYASRVLLQPDKALVRNVRIWRDVWWRYYHLHRDCIPAEGPDLVEELLIVDLKPLPAKMHESREQYQACVVEDRRKFLEEFPRRSGRIA